MSGQSMIKVAAVAAATLAACGCDVASYKELKDQYNELARHHRRAQEDLNALYFTTSKNRLVNLHRAHEGANEVDVRYLKKVVFNFGSKKLRFHLEASERVRPRFKIYFLSRTGRVVGEFTERWVWRKIKKGQKFVQTRPIKDLFETPYYFTVRFLQ